MYPTVTRSTQPPARHHPTDEKEGYLPRAGTFAVSYPTTYEPQVRSTPRRSGATCRSGSGPGLSRPDWRPETSREVPSTTTPTASLWRHGGGAKGLVGRRTLAVETSLGGYGRAPDSPTRMRPTVIYSPRDFRVHVYAAGEFAGKASTVESRRTDEPEQT